MKRILEPQAMESEEEVIAYDELVSGDQGDILDDCFVLSILNQGVQKGRILDIGTGPGRIPIKLLQKNQDLHIDAIDLSMNMLKTAKKNSENYSVHNYSLFRADGNYLPFGNNTYDMVISHVTLHHIPDPIPVLKEINRVLKPEGALLVRDLRRPITRWMVDVYGAVFGRDYDETQMKEYKDSLSAGFTKNEFKAMVKDAGIERAVIRTQFITHMSIERKAIPFEQSKYTPQEPRNNLEKKMRQFYISR